MKEPVEMTSNITSAEIKLARVLSANDRNIRLSGLRKLTSWLTSRVNAEEGTPSDEELSHVWVGLHYCLWMQDKPILQEELIDAFGGLLHTLGDQGTAALRFFDAFLEIECREWLSIDHHRLDKFLLLTRTMLNTVLVHLAKRQWEESALVIFLDSFRRRLTQVPIPESHDGLKFHVADIFVEELSKVEVEYEIPQEVAHRLVDPFCELLSTHVSTQLVTKVKKRVFNELIDQFQAYSLALHELEANRAEGNGDGMETDDASDDLPVRLNVDLQRLAARLEELRSTAKEDQDSVKKRKKSKETPRPQVRNRKMLKSVARELLRAAQFDESEFNASQVAEWEELKAVRGGKGRKRRRLRGVPLDDSLNEDPLDALDPLMLSKAAEAHADLHRPVRDDESDEEEPAEELPVPRKSKLDKRKQKKRKNKKR